MFGQPGFFAPRAPPDWSSREAHQLLQHRCAQGTLERLVDFDRINDAREMRFSVGAVNVRTGRFAYFDSDEITIRPEHVMASGALPPGFPAVEIDGEHYWDGGLVSNTPLQYVLDTCPRRSRLMLPGRPVPRPRPRPEKSRRGDPSAKRTSAIPAGPASRPTPFRESTTSATRSTRSTMAPRDLRTRPNGSSSTISAASPNGHRPARLSAVRTARRREGLRVQPCDDERPLGAGTLRCPGDARCRAVARAETREVGARMFDVLHDVLVGKVEQRLKQSRRRGGRQNS